MGFVKPPNILTFLLAFILGIVGTLAHLGVAIPVVGGFGFWLVFAAMCCWSSDVSCAACRWQRH